jgi:hypothetical protein
VRERDPAGTLAQAARRPFPGRAHLGGDVGGGTVRSGRLRVKALGGGCHLRPPGTFQVAGTCVAAVGINLPERRWLPLAARREGLRFWRRNVDGNTARTSDRAVSDRATRWFDGAARLGHGRDMSEIELGPVSERLDDEEIKTLGRLLEQAGAKYPVNDENHTNQIIASRLSEDAMTEFLDRLEAHDIAADIYLPVEFEGRLTVGDFRVASSQTLTDVLEEMKEELAVEEEEEYEDDEEEEDDDEEEEEGTVIEAQLRNIWRLVNDACSESLDKSVPLHLRI